MQFGVLYSTLRNQLGFYNLGVLYLEFYNLSALVERKSKDKAYTRTRLKHIEGERRYVL